MKNRLVFCEDFRISKRNNMVIIGNRSNGEWIKLTAECYQIIRDGIDRQYDEIELLNTLYDEEDKQYISSLLLKLKNLNIIYVANDLKVNSRNYKSINFAITERCNLLCKHCCVSAENKCLELITTQEIFRILDLIFECSPDCIVITGGEPLIRKDFSEISRYIKENYSGTLSLMTNGTLINKENAKSIAETFEEISISMDGYDDESCSEIRGHGVFDKIINGISLLQNYGHKKISLSMIVNKYTCSHIEEFKQLNEKLGTASVMRKFAPIGRGFINIDELMDLNSLKSFGPPSKASRYSSVCMESSSTSHKYATICGALKNQFFIGSDKYIYPCSALHLEEFRIEHIDKIKNLKEYMENDMYKETTGYKMYKSILPENDKYCNDCSINMFCSGCPIYVYMYKKSGIIDYFCQQQKTREEMIIWS